jgi:hypothetical protein
MVARTARICTTAQCSAVHPPRNGAAGTFGACTNITCGGTSGHIRIGPRSFTCTCTCTYSCTCTCACTCTCTHHDTGNGTVTRPVTRTAPEHCGA